MNQIFSIDKYYKIKFQYNPRIIEAVKMLPQRSYSAEDKTWLVPMTCKAEVQQFAAVYKFKFVDVTIQAPMVVPEIPELPELTTEIKLKRTPFPFQARGIQYAIDKKRIIIGDQPGLGKTTQAAAAVEGLDAFPCLVICPSSLKINWQREFDIVSGRKAMILTDSVKNNFHQYYTTGLADVFIVNFESLKKYFVDRIDKPGKAGLRITDIHFKSNIKLFKSVIVDESHRVKSFKAQMTKFTKGICQDKEVILLLTGTPVVNKPNDLISQLGIIDRMSDMGGYKYFLDRYCQGGNGAANLKELNYKLNTTCFYARKKSEVLKDLPAKVRQVVYCQIDKVHRQEYELANQDLLTYLEQFSGKTPEEIERSMRGEVMVRIGKLKNISARGKLNDVFDYIDDVLASGEKLVLFGHLKEVLNQFKDRYPDCVSITGDDTMASRQASVDVFQQNPKVKLIVCSIQAAGVGLTLTAASRVAFVELGWHSAIHDQCEDRCHRIGQTDSVQCTYFLGKDTIDEWVYSLIESKREMASSVSGAVDDVEVSVVDNFLNLFNKTKRI